MISKEDFKSINERINFLYECLQIEKRTQMIADLETESQAENFWQAKDKAEEVLKSLQKERYWVNLFKEGKQSLEDLELAIEMSQESEISEEELNQYHDICVEKVTELEFKNMLSAEEDSLDAVLQITAGAGGTESNDWAEMLMRMYIMWGEKNGYKVRELNFQAGEVAGVKTVTLEISGDHSFGYLKGENGVHRLVRISPFDSGARRHTSFASVYVYPLVDDSIEIEVNNSEVTWETFRSSGAGGQSVNKIETAVRLRHTPTGIVVENSETRSQLENKHKAMQLLKSRLYEIELEKKMEKRREIEGQKKKIEWGSQIRNYVMHPYKLVKDLRTGTETGNVEAVMNGEINEFLKSYLMKQNQL